MSSVEKFINAEPAKKAGALLNEFKKFAFKGNVIDLAVGVIIGAAFGKIIDSLVRHIIMPFISVILPTANSYTGWKATLFGKDVPYGLFIGELVNFLVVAFALYIFIVKFLGWLMKARKAEAAVAAAPAPTPDQLLLTEIRDLLKKRSGE